MHLSKSVRISFVALMGIFLLITLPSLAKIDPESIMGMWLFDEGKGGTAADASGNGNDAETGKATLWVDGVQEGEIDFNTDDGYGTGEGVFHIGRHFDRYTTGIIDEVILFNIALDEADMTSMMNDGIESVTAVEPLNKLTTTWGRIKKQ